MGGSDPNRARDLFAGPDEIGDRVRRRLFDMRGKRVVVTGAASGLGLAMAEIMAESGATVVLSDIDPESLEVATRRLGEQDLQVRSHVADITDPDQMRALFRESAETLGGLDVAFVNAGIGAGKSFRDSQGAIDVLPLEDWRRVLTVNLDGAFLTLRAAAAVMKPQRSGCIVVTASTAGLRAEPMVGYAYLAAKAAVVNVVRQAALELVAFGIRVNAIAPGPFRTNIGGPVPRPLDVEAAWDSTIPMGRWGDPEDIKGIALLLASPASSFVTGSIWTIDGGASALAQGSTSLLVRRAPEDG